MPNKKIRISRILILVSYGIFLATALSTAESFAETSPITDLSALQLSFCSVVSITIPFILSKKKGKLETVEWLVWLALALGFIFVALDDKLMFHERIDQAIHSWFQLKETRISDGIDDLIVGAYGACGMIFLLLNRKYFIFSKRLIICSKYAISLLFLMVLCDMRDVYGSGGLIREALTLMEEWAKIFGGGLFLVGLICALEDSLKMKHVIPKTLLSAKN